MKKTNVKTMTGRTGRPVQNQWIITDGNKRIFKSYNSICAVIDFDKEGFDRLVLGANWDYSRTTLKYLHKFLQETLNQSLTTNEIRKAIKNHDICFDADLI